MDEQTQIQALMAGVGYEHRMQLPAIGSAPKAPEVVIRPLSSTEVSNITSGKFDELAVRQAADSEEGMMFVRSVGDMMRAQDNARHQVVALALSVKGQTVSSDEAGSMPKPWLDAIYDAAVELSGFPTDIDPFRISELADAVEKASAGTGDDDALSLDGGSATGEDTGGDDPAPTPSDGGGDERRRGKAETFTAPDGRVGSRGGPAEVKE